MTLVTKKTSPQRVWKSPFFDDFDSFFDDFFKPTFKRDSEFLPAVELEESADHFHLAFDLPGVNKEDVEIEVSDGRLRVWGERKKETKTDSKGVYRSEKSYGKFERVFTLPETANLENIEASFNNGVLELNIAKQEKLKPKKISIN